MERTKTYAEKDVSERDGARHSKFSARKLCVSFEVYV